MLWRARPAFDRRASFFETRFSPRWIAAVVSAVGASVWLGLFAFKHVEYSNQLWWQFALHAEASRFLRASVGAAMGLWFAGVSSCVVPHIGSSGLMRADLEARGAIIAMQPSTAANLVYLRDKAVLFDEEKKSFSCTACRARGSCSVIRSGHRTSWTPDSTVSRAVRRLRWRAGVYQVRPTTFIITPISD